MKNINKYFKLYEAQAAAQQALKEALPKSEINTWFALDSSEGESLGLAAYDGLDGKPAIFHIKADRAFIFKEDGNNVVVPPTEEMLNELIEWLDEE